MTSTTLSIKDFASKLQQATSKSTTPEGNPIAYPRQTLPLITEDHTVVSFDVAGILKRLTPPPTIEHFVQDSIELPAGVRAAIDKYINLLKIENHLFYKEIDLTFIDENGSHQARAIVPRGFDYDPSDCIIIDGTNYTGDAW